MVRRIVLGALSLLLVGAVTAAGAQTPATGSVTGRITLAANGAPVHGASVIVVAARRQATSGEDGRYQVDNIPPGVYEVVVQREQLSTARQTVTVAAGQAATLDFALTVGVHEAVTVTASATGAGTTFESFNSITSIDSAQISKRASATIADVLQNEPGIAKRTFGPGTSRPIIRGFDGDRVLVMQDGVRTGDLSSQSGDHGVSIDPAGLTRIEVVKGPATLLYGSNAIGGVVNAITPQNVFRSSPFTGTLGGLTLDAGSANRQGGFSGNVQHGTGPWLVYASGTGRRTGNYDAPDVTIPNSGTRLGTGEGGFGWTGTRAFFGASFGAERNRYGIPFAGMFEGEEDAEIDLQAKRHNLRFDAGARNLGGRFADAIRVTGSFLDYEHDEIEIEDGTETLGTRFTNQVFTLRAEVEQPVNRRLTGRIGAELLTRDYGSVGEEALAPATTQKSFAAFIYEELTVGKHRLLLGGRAERVSYDADFEDGAVRRTFTSVSGSLGAHANLGAGTALVLNVTGASRAPALEELFNFGPHIGNLAFEIGNPDLALERTIGVDVSLRARRSESRAELNVFTYNISNFVFLDVTNDFEDGLAVANFTQGDSRFTGADGAVHFHLAGRMNLTAGLSYVRAKLTETGESLPRIPPLQGRLELGLDAGNFTFSPEIVFSAKQDRVFRNETSTSAWATGNFAVSWSRTLSHQSHLVTFQVQNLANTNYRLHTSFLKHLAPEIGRGVKVSYTVRFF